MITTDNNGRLCNQIIRNLAFSLIAKKHDLQVEYSSRDLIRRLGIDLFSGSKSYHPTSELNDNNYFAIYNSDSDGVRGLNPNKHYFQTKEITRFLHEYLHTADVKSKIIEHNPFKARYNNNTDAFVHIRLTDAAHNNPGAQYYLNVLRSVQFDNLYIATDDSNHAIVRKIMELYPNTQFIQRDEVSTIQFGSTCKHVVLSHGSFSAVIGYLSFLSTVYYPEYEPNKIWYGDMFSIQGWIQCRVRGE